MNQIIIIVISIFLVSASASASRFGGIHHRKAKVRGLAAVQSRISSADGTKTQPFDVAYDIELMPGQIFTGYWYYWTRGDAASVHLREFPEVSWLTLEGETFTSTSCSDVHALAFHFIAPNSPGTYISSIPEDSGKFVTINVTLTVTTTPTPDYTYEDTVTVGDSLVYDDEWFWDGFTEIGCDPVFFPGKTENIRYTVLPEIDQLKITPSQRDIGSGSSGVFHVKFTSADTGFYTTYLMVEYQWDAYPEWGEWNIHVQDYPHIISPQAGDLLIAGEQDTIRWGWRLTDQLLDIEYSADGGITYGIVVLGTRADSGYYVWNVPDTLSTRVRIKIIDQMDPPDSVVSDIFKIKGYFLTRLTQAGEYERFDVRFHAWFFPNGATSSTPPYNNDYMLWPEYWWQQFDYENGNDPNTNLSYSKGGLAFQTAWRAAFIDWPLFVDVYGASACYNSLSSGDYKVSAVLRWWVNRSVWNGSCGGMALTTALQFGMPNQFAAAFPGFGAGGNNLSTLLLNDARRTIINQLWEYYSGAEHLQFAAIQGQKTPRETLADLKKMFLSDNREFDGYLYIADGVSVAHAVNPYRLKRLDSMGRFALYVYDNNYPGDATKVIIVDSLQNEWGYAPYHWGGQNGFFIMDPIETYLHHPSLPGTSSTTPVASKRIAQSSSFVQVYNTQNAAITIEGIDTAMIGFNGTSTFNTTKGFPLIPITSTPQPPVGYFLPTGEYRVHLSQFDTSWSYIAIFADSLIYHYSRQDAQHSQTDDLTFGRGFSTVNPDSLNKLIEIQTIVPEDSAEKVITLDGLSLSHGDSLHVEKLHNNELSLASYGAPKSYSLELQSGSQAGTTKFNHAGINLSSNTTHVISPPWDNLAHGQVKILVDNGNDGTIDDSLLVDNQVLDAKDRISVETPKEFALSQNYPNPFNPTTTIHYELPKASYVTLKVFNVLGQEVAVLVDGMQDVGYKTVEWNASGTLSGVYFYRLTAGNFIETKKLIFMK